MNFFRNLTVRGKLIALLSLFGLSLLAFGGMSFRTLNQVKVHGPLYGEIAQAKDLLADILPPPEYLVESYLLAFQMADATDRSELDALAQRGKQLRKDYEARHQYWVEHLSDGPMKETMVVASYEPGRAFLDACEQELVPMLVRGESKKAQELLNGPLKERYAQHRSEIDRVVTMANEFAAKVEDTARSETARGGSTLIVMGLAAAAVVAVVGFLIIRAIVNPINMLTLAAAKLSEGDVEQRIDHQSSDETGVLAESFRGTMTTIKSLMAETGRLVTAAKQGQLDQRGDASAFAGAYRQLVQGFNDTLDAIVRPIGEASNVLEQVAARDLTPRVQGDYQGDHAQIKKAVNSAIDNLAEALSQVTVGAEQVTAASTQIAKGAQSLAQGASEQASSLEEVSSSLEEMSSMTKQNADNSLQGKLLATEARQAAERGNEAVERMGVAIAKIKESSDATAKIVKTIDEIAFQTNLLALNAAVEAARAGEAGKGFAVVAEEVRNLAQRSAAAAKNTADLIEESVKNADGGVRITDEVAKALAEIAEGNRKVNDLVAEIAAASGEQSKGIDQINLAVQQLDRVTQQTAANSEESASAAEELNSQAATLAATVGQFALSARGRSMSAPPARRPLPERTRSSAKTCDAGDFSDFGEPARELELVAAGVDD